MKGDNKNIIRIRFLDHYGGYGIFFLNVGYKDIGIGRIGRLGFINYETLKKGSKWYDTPTFVLDKNSAKKLSDKINAFLKKEGE